MQKIQYFSSDLSAVLGIGHIENMHVDVVNGAPVLRIECQDVMKDEYKTVKVSKRTIKPARDQKASSQTRDKDLGGKLIDIGKKFMSNKEKPNFMKDAGF